MGNITHFDCLGKNMGSFKRLIDKCITFASKKHFDKGLWLYSHPGELWFIRAQQQIQTWVFSTQCLWTLREHQGEVTSQKLLKDCLWHCPVLLKHLILQQRLLEPTIITNLNYSGELHNVQCFTMTTGQGKFCYHFFFLSNEIIGWIS